MNGTINATVKVYEGSKLAMEARSGDRVQITNGILTQLARNGTTKLFGSYTVDLRFVTMDVVEPPVDPPPPIEPHKPSRVIVETPSGTYIATEFTKLS